MVTPANCPQCGSVLPEGARACPACGYQLGGVQDPVTGPQAGPPPQPAGGQPSLTAASATASVNEVIDQTLERWRVSRSGLLVAAGLLAFVALFIGTLAHISYLTAGDSDLGRKFDAQTWFNLAIGGAIAAFALLLLVRWQSGAPAPIRDRNPDLQVTYVLLGLIAFFCLAGLFKGFDDSFDAQDSWFSYARVFAFLLIGWLVISRPIPDLLGTTSSAMIGLGLVGIAGGVLLLGQFMALSDDISNFITGRSFQALGTVGMLVAVGWFLGLRPRSAI